MSSLPPAPTQQFSFTAFSTAAPTLQQPGVQLDAEFSRTNGALAQLLAALGTSLNADGSINPSAIPSNYWTGSLVNPGGVAFAAPNSPITRTLAQRAADEPRMADSGALCNGVADDAIALNAWMATIPSPSRVWVDGRSYLILSDLTPPLGVSIIGPWSTATRGEIAATNDYTQVPGSFVVDPAATIRLAHSCSFVGNFVRRRGLVPGTTLAALAANHLGKSGTGVTVGPYSITANDTAADAVIDGNIVLGFGLGIDVSGHSRVLVSNNKLDNLRGVRFQASYNGSTSRSNYSWPFLLGGSYPSRGASLFSTQGFVAITSSSIVGGKRRFVTAAAHGFSTGWPVLIGDTHVGAGVGPCLGVSPVTVINTTTFDLETTQGLTTPYTGLPSGPGTGNGAGGYAAIGAIVNYGPAFSCANAMDGGRFDTDEAWGHAIGLQVDGSNTVSVTSCTMEAYSGAGYYGAVNYKITGTSDGCALVDCRGAGSSTGIYINTSSVTWGNRHTIVGGTLLAVSGSFLDVEGGNVTAVALAMDTYTHPSSNVVMGASAASLELVGTPTAPAVVNNTGAASKLRITGGAYGYSTKKSAGYAAAGTTQGTATPITTAIADIYAASAGQGIILVPGIETKVYNLSGVTINVYPPSTQFMEGNLVNAPVTMAPNAVVNFAPLNDVAWWRG